MVLLGPMVKPAVPEFHANQRLIFTHEFLHLMGTEITDPIPEIRSVPEFAFTGFETCGREFLELFRKLTEDTSL